MMRSRERTAVAVRRPDGGIEVRKEELGSFLRSRWARLPLVRGLVTLWDSLGIGMKALMFSADVSTGEEVKIPPHVMWGTVAFSLLLGIGLFFALPALLATSVDAYITSHWLSNFFEGFIRLVVFLGYLLSIGRIPDIKRVFAYHGAEHRVINAFEAGDELSVRAAMSYPTAHPRCGTGFLLIVVVVSVFVFGFIGRPPIVLRLASRLVLLPLIAALSYEVVRFAARRPRNFLARIILAPSLLLQSLTTREPTEDMVEVALIALTSVIEAAETAEEPVLNRAPTGLAAGGAAL
ncbi:MAG: DUF1385 domain-containing protein [Anaerolineae bacterium]